MTRKDFQLIADVIKAQHDQLIARQGRAKWDKPGGSSGTVRNIARTLADELANTNPRFNKALFLKACGIS